MDDLRRHVVVDHRQPASDVERVPLDVIEKWHVWEHHPLYSRADHAHDDFTARRRDVPLVDLDPSADSLDADLAELEASDPVVAEAARRLEVVLGDLSRGGSYRERARRALGRTGSLRTSLRPDRRS